MQIIKEGKIPTKEYNLKCHKCDCEAIYTDEDIKSDRDGKFVFCPCCGELIEHEPKKIGGTTTIRQIHNMPFTNLCRVCDELCDIFNNSDEKFRHSEVGVLQYELLQVMKEEIVSREAHAPRISDSQKGNYRPDLCQHCKHHRFYGCSKRKYAECKKDGWKYFDNKHNCSTKTSTLCKQS